MSTSHLSADAIEAMAGLAKTHFLDARAKRLNRSLGDATGLTGLGIHLIEVAPGDATTALHRHHHEEEAVYVLSGQAEAQIGEECFAVGPGDFLAYPKGGAAHRLVNAGDDVLRCLVVGQRLDHDVCDYPEQGKRLYRNAGSGRDLVDLEAITYPEMGAK